MAKTKTKAEPKPQDQEIYEVVMISYEHLRPVESVIDRFTNREVAEFRMNGAKMFAQVGDTIEYYIRPAKLILDQTTMQFLGRLGR